MDEKINLVNQIMVLADELEGVDNPDIRFSIVGEPTEDDYMLIDKLNSYDFHFTEYIDGIPCMKGTLVYDMLQLKTLEEIYTHLINLFNSKT